MGACSRPLPADRTCPYVNYKWLTRGPPLILAPSACPRSASASCSPQAGTSLRRLPNWLRIAAPLRLPPRASTHPIPAPPDDSGGSSGRTRALPRPNAPATPPPIPETAVDLLVAVVIQADIGGSSRGGALGNPQNFEFASASRNDTPRERYPTCRFAACPCPAHRLEFDRIRTNKNDRAL